MAEPFDDPRAKLDNAVEHIAKAERLFNEYVAASSKVTQIGHPGGIGPVAYNFGPQGPLPKNIPMAVGDAIHNLRSALDIMAGDIVQASGKSRKGVHFPFGGSREGLEEQFENKRFNCAKPEAIELLRSMRPYKGGNALLRAVHDLDLTDKHNFIIPANNRNSIDRIQIGGSSFIGCTFGNSGLGDVASSGRTPIHVGNIQTALVFAPDQPLGGEGVFETLHAMAELVAGIIEAFAKLFVGGSGPAGSNPPA